MYYLIGLFLALFEYPVGRRFKIKVHEHFHVTGITKYFVNMHIHIYLICAIIALKKILKIHWNRIPILGRACWAIFKDFLNIIKFQIKYETQQLL